MIIIVLRILVCNPAWYNYKLRSIAHINKNPASFTYIYMYNKLTSNTSGQFALSLKNQLCLLCFSFLPSSFEFSHLVFCQYTHPYKSNPLA